MLPTFTVAAVDALKLATMDDGAANSGKVSAMVRLVSLIVPLTSVVRLGFSAALNSKVSSDAAELLGVPGSTVPEPDFFLHPAMINRLNKQRINRPLMWVVLTSLIVSWRGIVL